MCVTVGTTSNFVVGKDGWCYFGCKDCNKKNKILDEPYKCDCGTHNESIVSRFFLVFID